MDNKIFNTSIVISLMVHLGGVIYFSLNEYKAPLKNKKPLEVVYRSVKTKKAPPKEEILKDLELIKKTLPKRELPSFAHKPDSMSLMNKGIKEVSRMNREIKFERKLDPKIRPLDLNRKITVPILKAEKISNPKYVNYNQLIRQKIKDRAYSFVDSPDFESGQVYLTFVLSSSGHLKQIKVIDERSDANVFLKDVGLRSIEESHPFAPFPQDLRYPELSFNVVISFELNERP